MRGSGGGEGWCAIYDSAVMGDDCKFHPHFTCSTAGLVGPEGLNTCHVALIHKETLIKYSATVGRIIRTSWQ